MKYLALLKKYWLSSSAAIVGIWTALDPATQHAIIHQIANFIHRYPHGASLVAAIAVIAADLKGSPLTK